MRTGYALTGVGYASRRSSLRPGRLVGLSARPRAHRLDTELAAGIATWRSPARAARAVQLTSTRSRRRLASSLERVLEDARQPKFMLDGSAVVTPCGAVLAERPQILALAARLRYGAPVAAEGTARLRLLLSDGSSPIYARAHAGALASALTGVVGSLEIVG